MTERLRCCVPFCRRTTKQAEFPEWICGDHWCLLPKQRRRAYGRHVKRWRRYGPTHYGIAANRIWNRLKAMAIERAAGIS